MMTKNGRSVFKSQNIYVSKTRQHKAIVTTEREQMKSYAAYHSPDYRKGPKLLPEVIVEHMTLIEKDL